MTFPEPERIFPNMLGNIEDHTISVWGIPDCQICAIDDFEPCPCEFKSGCQGAMHLIGFEADDDGDCCRVLKCDKCLQELYDPVS